jgi:hypothetical protein
MFCFLQIGVKGKASNINNGLDCDVLVAEVEFHMYIIREILVAAVVRVQ